MNSTQTSFPAPAGAPRKGEPTWEVVSLYPAQGEWTEADYFGLKTNRLVELSDGCLEFLPMPTLAHQLIVAYLHSLLAGFVAAKNLGLAVFAPLPVRLRPGKIREPDVLFLRSERVRERPDYPTGADLVMEVVSAGHEDRKRDLETKPGEYAAAGISEYWIVDPREQRITILVLDNGVYRVHGEFVPGAQAASLLLPGFAADVAAVFAAARAVE